MAVTDLPADYLFKVYPNPLLTNSPAASAICSNANTDITLTSNVVVALFTWTCTPSSAAMTGWANNCRPNQKPYPGADKLRF